MRVVTKMKFKDAVLYEVRSQKSDKKQIFE